MQRGGKVQVYFQCRLAGSRRAAEAALLWRGETRRKMRDDSAPFE